MQLVSRRKKIVILGGGCGGVVAATHLGRKLGADHDVILIDRRADHIFMPAFLFIMIGERQPRDISRSLNIIEKRNVRVDSVGDTGHRSDPPGSFAGKGKDQLRLLDHFARLADPARLGAGLCRRHRMHPWEMESALRLRESLESFRGGRVVVGVPLGPYRCPPAPYEAQWMLDGYFRQKGIRERVQIDYFTREPEPTGEAHDPTVWMDAESKRRSIKQHYEFVVRSIDPEEKGRPGSVQLQDPLRSAGHGAAAPAGASAAR